MVPPPKWRDSRGCAAARDLRQMETPASPVVRKSWVVRWCARTATSAPLVAVRPLNAQVSATGTVAGSWNAPGGGERPKCPMPPRSTFPIDPGRLLHRRSADFRLLPGGVVQNGAGLGHRGACRLGIQRRHSGLERYRRRGQSAAGTYCVTGNAYVQGSSVALPLPSGCP